MQPPLELTVGRLPTGQSSNCKEVFSPFQAVFLGALAYI